MADLICNVVRRYRYDTLQRIDTPDGRRYVNQEGIGLPSVTTILDATKAKAKLEEWQNKVGIEEANRIRESAANVGTWMHSFIESHIKDRPIRAARVWDQLKGFRMGASLIEKFFPNIDEVWGNEVMVHYSDKYAGTTDLVGIYRGKPSIIDFKQSNKMKKREWLDDYFYQLTAYAQAHNWQHGTEIRQGVILMASQDGGLQEFLLVDREFDHFQHGWNLKVTQAALAPRVVAVKGLESPEGTESRTADTFLLQAEQAFLEGLEPEHSGLKNDSEPGKEASDQQVSAVGFRQVEQAGRDELEVALQKSLVQPPR